MKVTPELLTVALVTMLLVISCNKPYDPVPVTPPEPREPPQEFQPWELEPGIYISGSYQGNAKAWWKGTIQVLPSADYYTFGTSVHVTGGDVFVAGYDSHLVNPHRAVVWKNGVATALTNGLNEAAAFSVYVWDKNVYVAGYERDRTARVAMLWKNGVPEKLSDGTRDATATSVCVRNGDVYVVGSESNGSGQVAILWKNGQAQPLSDSSSDMLMYAESVFLSGTDVYVAGYGITPQNTRSRAIVWKNGIEQTLASKTFSYAKSIFVLNDDLFVAGYEFLANDDSGTSKAVLWKNGEVQKLTSGDESGQAQSVSVSGTDVYVVGFEGDAARVWKNGQGKTIAGASYFNSIFIKE